MKKFNFFTVLACFFIALLLAITGCVTEKKVALAEEDLVGLNKFDKEALVKNLFSLDDLNLAKSLIAKKKVAERKVPQFSFLVNSSRMSEIQKTESGIYLEDNKSATYMRLFSSTDNPEDVKNKVISLYSKNQYKNFDKHVIAEVSGYFCPNLPEQEFTVYKLKCSINRGFWYFSIATTKFVDVDYYVMFYNYNYATSKTEDTLALFFQTFKKRES
jgi:hypothetical protein